MAAAPGKVLITGGAGFIGTHLAERLCRTHRVVLFDNYRRDSLTGLPLAAHPNVQVFRGDVLNQEEVQVAAQGVDTVLHLAAIAGVSSYYALPLQTLRVNVLGTVNVLEAAVAAGTRRFVYFSTSEVFGPRAENVAEDDPCNIGPPAEKRWVYAVSKLAGENFVLRYGEEYGLQTTCVRPFNVYGPRQTGEGAVSNFCRAAVRGEPLRIYGDGRAVRAWCFISDLVDAVELVLAQSESAGQVFNIGNPREVETTRGLAERVARLMPGVTLVTQPVERAEVGVRIPCIDKARKVLGYEPKVNLDEGLRLTLAWYKETMRP